MNKYYKNNNVANNSSDFLLSAYKNNSEILKMLPINEEINRKNIKFYCAEIKKELIKRGIL